MKTELFVRMARKLPTDFGEEPTFSTIVRYLDYAMPLQFVLSDFHQGETERVLPRLPRWA